MTRCRCPRRCPAVSACHATHAAGFGWLIGCVCMSARRAGGSAPALTAPCRSLCHAPCPPPPVPAATVRLVGGATAREGRLEVLHAGQWGSVCNDKFDDAAASVSLHAAGAGLASTLNSPAALQCRALTSPSLLCVCRWCAASWGWGARATPGRTPSLARPARAHPSGWTAWCAPAPRQRWRTAGTRRGARATVPTPRM